MQDSGKRGPLMPNLFPYAKLDTPQTLNLYSYVQNNPLSKNDPDGHCSAPSVGKGQAGICIDLYIQTRMPTSSDHASGNMTYDATASLSYTFDQEACG